MARLAIGKEFLAEYAKLDRNTRSAVDTAIAEFARQTHAGPFLETPRDSRDSRIRTIGIDGVWRGVVLAPDSGDTYCLLTVLPHEKVNAFAASHRFGAARASRALEVRDEEELRLILAHPFAAWRTFLHPSQREIAYRVSYSGPAQVTGGPGTGKTVTVLHRAAFLAERAGQPRLPRPDPADHVHRQPGRGPRRAARPADPGRRGARPDRGAQRGPAGLPRRQAGPRHAGPRRRAGAASSLGAGRRRRRAGPHPGVPEARVGAGHPRPGPARRAGVPDLPAHRPGETAHQGPAQPGLAGGRAGHGGARRARQSTHIQLANEATHLLREPGAPLYRHIIVDEGQDLHPAQWRLLRAAVDRARTTCSSRPTRTSASTTTGSPWPACGSACGGAAAG